MHLHVFVKETAKEIYDWIWIKYILDAIDVLILLSGRSMILIKKFCNILEKNFQVDSLIGN